MKGKIHSTLGSINISEDVISTIAGSAACECFGVIGMAAVSMKDGFARLLKRDSLQKGIEVSVDDEDKVSLRLHIIVAYSVNIYAVAENLIETVRYQVEEQTGMTVEDVERGVLRPFLSLSASWDLSFS